MNSVEVFNLLEKAGAVNSQNVKAEVLRPHIGDPLFAEGTQLRAGLSRRSARRSMPIPPVVRVGRFSSMMIHWSGTFSICWLAVN